MSIPQVCQGPGPRTVDGDKGSIHDGVIGVQYFSIVHGTSNLIIRRGTVGEGEG